METDATRGGRGGKGREGEGRGGEGRGGEGRGGERGGEGVGWGVRVRGCSRSRQLAKPPPLHSLFPAVTRFPALAPRDRKLKGGVKAIMALNRFSSIGKK